MPINKDTISKSHAKLEKHWGRMISRPYVNPNDEVSVVALQDERSETRVFAREEGYEYCLMVVSYMLAGQVDAETISDVLEDSPIQTKDLAKLFLPKYMHPLIKSNEGVTIQLLVQYWPLPFLE